VGIRVAATRSPALLDTVPDPPPVMPKGEAEALELTAEAAADLRTATEASAATCAL